MDTNPERDTYPKIPKKSFKLLSRKHLDDISDFVERYDLEVNVGKLKTADFLLKLWNEEERKRKKGERYNRKMLGDAEKLIGALNAAFADGTISRSGEPGEKGEKTTTTKYFERRRAEMEESIRTTLEMKIRDKLKELFVTNSKAGESLVQQLLGRADAEQLAERISSLIHGINERNEDLEKYARDVVPTLVQKLDEVKKCQEDGRHEFAAQILEQVRDINGAVAEYLKEAETSEGSKPARAAEACEKAAGLILRIDPQKAVELYIRGGALYERTPPYHSIKRGSYDIDYSSFAARLYSKAAELLRDSDPKRAAEFCERAGQLYENIRYGTAEYGKAAGEAYLAAAELLEKLKRPDRSRINGLYEKAAENLARHAAYLNGGRQSFRIPLEAAGEYVRAANLMKNVSSEKAALWHEEAAKVYEEIGEHGKAARQYASAAETLKKTEPQKAATLSEKSKQMLLRSMASAEKEISRAETLIKTDPAAAAEAYATAAARYADCNENGRAADAYLLAAKAAVDTPKKASELLALAASSFVGEGKPYEAIKFYHQAARLVEPVAASELLVNAGDRLANALDFINAARMYLEAAKLIRKSNPERASEILVTLGTTWQGAVKHSINASEKAEFRAYAATSYTEAGDLIFIKNPAKAAELYDLAKAVTKKKR